MPPAPGDPVLELENLSVQFATDAGPLNAITDTSLVIRRGRTLALVGESGCGKSVTSQSILRLIRPPGRITSGKILLHSLREGEIDIASLNEGSSLLYRVRGGLVSMIFQEPMTALSPVHTVGDQVAEAIHTHCALPRKEVRRRALDMLGKVGFTPPDQYFDRYPHELSGGMRQRVVIAMALVCRPELLIADEPTTALDTTVQIQILRLIKALQQELGYAVLFITHDLGVVAQVADDIAVMYLGRIIEHGPVRDVLKQPRHPYTCGLLRAIPGLRSGCRLVPIDGAVPALSAIPAGCPFHPRCPHARPGLCDRGSAPDLQELTAGHAAACLRAAELTLAVDPR